MQIDIQNSGRATDDAFRTLAERRVAFALGRFAARIRQLRVRIADANGPRGGVDMQCMLHARLAPAGEVVVQVIDETPEAALSRALDRLARRISDETQRRRETHRRPRRSLIGERTDAAPRT